MAIPVLILGESGSGKTASLRNFGVDDIGLFNVANKPLPFKKQLPKYNTSNYKKIMAAMLKSDKMSFVIDDSQYLMAFQMFAKARETGYGKFTDIALDFKNLIDFIIYKLPDDKIVYLLHHTEITETGKTKAKTSGKMIDNQLTLEGLFSIVLLAVADGTDHKFITQSDGTTTCKSPMEMFKNLEIENDLSIVDKTIREYWELAPLNSEKEVEEEE